MTYNRSQIMREAGRLMRLGWTRSEAMKAAWASAKADHFAGVGNMIPRQQEAGLRAALRRYGVDTDRLALRAQEAVRAIVAAIAQDRVALLPPPVEGAIELTRGEDGVYRI